MYANILSIIFPYDIVEYIMFYVKIEIAPLIVYYFKKFLKRKIMNINNMIDFAHFNCKLGLAMSNYQLFYINRILTAQDVLKTLSSCNCCIRHKKNRPNKVGTYKSNVSNNNWDYRNRITCFCPCRHLSRFICKEINTINI